MFTHQNARKVNANISFTIKRHLIRGAFYLLLLLAVCAIPFALAQSLNSGTSKPGVTKTTVPPSLFSLSSTSKTHAFPVNPDFAPPGVIQEQLSSPYSGAAAVASGTTDANGSVFNQLGAPLFPEGGCGTPGPWSTSTPGPPARYRAGVPAHGGRHAAQRALHRRGAGAPGRGPGRQRPSPVSRART